MKSSILSSLDHVLDRTVLFGYDRIGYYVRRPLWSGPEAERDLSGKTAVVTGANSGLGRATALGLAQRGARVIMVCRSKERGEEALASIRESSGNSQIELYLADLSEQTAVRDVADRVLESQSRLDLLINNAGVLPDTRQLTNDGLELTFAVNTLACFTLTNRLAPLLEQNKDARVINISSGGQYLARVEVDDLQFEKEKFDGTLAYARTKRMELYLTSLWADYWRKSHAVSAYAMHPGWADTPAVRTSLPIFHTIMQMSLRTPEEGADTILWLSARKSANQAEGSGEFFFDRRARPYHRLERTRATADEVRALWERCCELSGYDGPIRPSAASFARAAERA